MKSNKKQIIWSLIFIALIVLTVWVIVKQNESFSIEGFINYVSAAKWQWIALAFLCMVGFIVFEGLAVLQLCKAFGYKEKVKRGIVYSAVDIYFSAITPSATGGQPASAMCMMQDGIPGAVTTIVLLLNLTLYTIAIIVIGAVLISIVEGMSIGDALWWSFVTFTTVGYGDILLKTQLGKSIAVLLMIIGIGVIGVITTSITLYIANGGRKMQKSYKEKVIEDIKNKLDNYENLTSEDIEEIIKILKALKK